MGKNQQTTLWQEDGYEATGATEDLNDGGQLERLIQAMEQRQGPARDKFKPLTFEGTGNVGYFIMQLNEVAEVNDWRAAAAMLPFREALKDSAKDCGQKRQNKSLQL